MEQVLTKSPWMDMQDEVLEQCPEGPARPNRTKLFDILPARVELGDLVRIGEGQQYKPLRYGQAGRDLPEKWNFLLRGFPMLTMKQVLDSYKYTPLGDSR